MKQLQFYKYAAIGLFILNIAMLVFFFSTRPPIHARGGDFKRGAIDILNLDEKQAKIFFDLAKDHQQKMEVFNDQQRELLEPYFESLIDSTKKGQNTLIKVEELERQKLESTYQHFQDIKSILKKEQLSDFEEFVKHAIKRILSRTNRKPRPPKNKE